MFWDGVSKELGAILSCMIIFCGVHGSIGTCFVELNGVNVLDVIDDLTSVDGVSRGCMLLFMVSSKILVMIISHMLVVDLKASKRSWKTMLLFNFVVMAGGITEGSINFFYHRHNGGLIIQKSSQLFFQI
jgi:hypothetical protein